MINQRHHGINTPSIVRCASLVLHRCISVHILQEEKEVQKETPSRHGRSQVITWPLEVIHLKLTKTPLKIGLNAPKGNWYSNHPFSGAKMLVSGRVHHLQDVGKKKKRIPNERSVNNKDNQRINQPYRVFHEINHPFWRFLQLFLETSNTRLTSLFPC